MGQDLLIMPFNSSQKRFERHPTLSGKLHLVNELEDITVLTTLNLSRFLRIN